MSVVDNKFKQDEGFEKTYAHYLLFKKDSKMLNAVLNGLSKDDNEIQKYLTMFDETLNKIHVTAGLIEYGNSSSSDPMMMKEMLEYVDAPTVSDLKSKQKELESKSNTLTNKKTLDVIHELVITYLPDDYFASIGNTQFKTNVNDNLLKSLKLYLKNNPTITPTKKPSNIADVTPQLIKNRASRYIYDEDKILAVAAFYDEAHNVDKEKAILSVAYAYEKKQKQISELFDGHIKYLSKKLNGKPVTHYKDSLFREGNTVYLVYQTTDKDEYKDEEQFELDNETKKITQLDPSTKQVDEQLIANGIQKIKMTNNGSIANTNHTSSSTIIKYADSIVEMLIKSMGKSVPSGNTNIPFIIIDQSTSAVYYTIGDGNCFYHALLHLSTIYQMCDRKLKQQVCYLFRAFLAKNVKKITNTPDYDNATIKQIGWPDWTKTEYPTYDECLKLQTSSWIEYDTSWIPNICAQLFGVGINIVKVFPSPTQFEGIKNDKLQIYMYNPHDLHFSIIMKPPSTGSDIPSPFFADTLAITGGKTRKPRIFKKRKTHRKK